MQKTMSQKRNSFDKETLIKIAKGAGIAGGAAVALYVLQWLTTVDFGPYTAAAVAIISILINVVKEWKKGE